MTNYLPHEVEAREARAIQADHSAEQRSRFGEYVPTERCPDLDSCPELAAKLPNRCLSRLRAYAMHHEPVGDFLTAVLENDFAKACCLADDVNAGLLVEYAKFVHNAMPSACHGSPEKVNAWLAKCEHGIMEGDWCEPCNLEYKRAAREAEAVE